MERVKKQDLAMYNETNNNVATIKDAFGVFGYAATQVISYLTGFFLFALSLAIDGDIEYAYDTTAWNMATLLGLGLIAISIAAIVRLVIANTPSIYFVGNEIYIRDGRDYYIKVLREEIDEYSWNTCASRSYYSLKGNNYSNVFYWGYLNIVAGGVTYRLSCSSLKKTKHYLDGFMNGLSVNENTFDGDKLQQISRRMYLVMPIIVSVIIFAAIMFTSASNVITIISAILFSMSCALLFATSIILITSRKTIRQIHKDYYDVFATNQFVKFRTSDEIDNIQNVNLNDDN